MQTKTQKPPRQPSHPIYANEGLSPKKTALIIVTVIGCIAILWPKVFYPMMFGSTTPKANPVKEPQRGPGGCCDVVLDRDTFFNSTIADYGPQPFRKNAFNILQGEILSLRQERPAHLHPESIYQAMRERGRAIPATQTVPILERKGSPSNPPPRYVEGRPGPIPGMRPPMGAGALHQPQPKGNSMGFIMPIYTIGIIVFFGYTIMKVVFKKPIPNAPYGPAPTDPNFRKEVFGLESRHVEDLHGTPLVVTAIQGLIDAADQELKLRENKATTDLSKQTDENSTSTKSENVANGHTTKEHESEDLKDQYRRKFERTSETQARKKREGSADRSVASKDHSEKDDMPEPQSIYLEGALAHESKILISDAETKREEVYDAEFNGSEEEPAVILSSKMTLSLINLDNSLDKSDEEDVLMKGLSKNKDVESPLADDIEIIGHDENDE